MRLTHLGHSCLLVEVADRRLLIDPGNYSADFTSLTDLDALLLTHQHADHADPERLPGLLEGNPDAVVIAEPETADLLREHLEGSRVLTPLTEGTTTTLGSVTVSGVGSRHAINHGGVRRCGNTGFVVTTEGEPTLFHPGDAYDADPGREVDVLALPINAPWAAVRDTLAFENRVTARWIVPIHDALLSDTGRAGYLMHVETFGPDQSSIRDLADGASWQVEGSAGG